MLINLLLWSFAFFGLFVLLEQLWFRFGLRAAVPPATCLLITVKNQEDSLEFWLREILRLVNSHGNGKIRMIVLDDHSQDGTAGIAARMAHHTNAFAFMEMPAHGDLFRIMEEVCQSQILWWLTLEGSPEEVRSRIGALAYWLGNGTVPFVLSDWPHN